MKKIELVAPAGGYEQLRSAVLAGADSVYAGFEKYSARAYADNFNLKTFEKASLYCDLHNVKLYLALNTLIKEDELYELTDFLTTLITNIKIDAFIIQDFAVLKILKDLGSAIPIHISTQMNIHNLSSAEFLKTFGIKRIILAREMTFKEISELAKKDIADIEIFVHGSQCYSYSGQCYFSSMVGQRSGNRGTCPQPCRLKYRIADENSSNFRQEGYFISKSDLLLADRLPELIKAGIKALKIEGRMKTPEYVAVVTNIYRKYIDAFYENREQCLENKELQKLKQVFSRKLTAGYFFKKFPEDIITSKKSGSTGNLFGRISDIRLLKEKKIMIVDSEMNLRKGDVLEIWTRKGNEKITVKNFVKEKNENKKTKKNKYKIETKKNIFFAIGDRVFRYFDKELEEEIKKILSHENITDQNLERIKKKSAPKEKMILKKNIIKIKNSIIYEDFIKKEQPYGIIKKLKSDNSISLIISRIKDLRNIIQYIFSGKLSLGLRKIKLNLIYDPYSEKADSFERINEHIREFYDISTSISNQRILFYFSTPPIIYNSSFQKVVESLKYLLKNNFFNFYVTNYAFLDFLNNYKKNKKSFINIILAHNFNITNSFALSSLAEKIEKLRLREIVLSPEITIEEADKAMADFYYKITTKDHKNFLPLATFYSYGYFPIMTARVKYDFGSKFFLKDRKNFVFMAKNDFFGNVVIFNSKKHNLIMQAGRLIEGLVNGCFIDGRLLDTGEILFTLNAFIKAISINRTFIIDYNNKNKIRLAQKEMKSLTDSLNSSEYFRDFTKGHALKKVI